MCLSVYAFDYGLVSDLMYVIALILTYVPPLALTSALKNETKGLQKVPSPQSVGRRDSRRCLSQRFCGSGTVSLEIRAEVDRGS